MHNTNGTVYTTLHKDISDSQALRAPQETKLGNAALSEIGKLVTSINWKGTASFYIHQLTGPGDLVYLIQVLPNKMVDFWKTGWRVAFQKGDDGYTCSNLLASEMHHQFPHQDTRAFPHTSSSDDSEDVKDRGKRPDREKDAEDRRKRSNQEEEVPALDDCSRLCEQRQDTTTSASPGPMVLQHPFGVTCERTLHSLRTVELMDSCIDLVIIYSSMNMYDET